ncbi:unnamed protein product [Paramecium octaurelia]|uniref:Uncharacterized protein n=1 Tax=Paramecium octaurelia TaxID=43137 RepID=A0A8S1S897_PAROT|nr:unnamed protein product [Paramecium octaurelia]
MSSLLRFNEFNCSFSPPQDFEKTKFNNLFTQILKFFPQRSKQIIIYLIQNINQNQLKEILLKLLKKSILTFTPFALTQTFRQIQIQCLFCPFSWECRIKYSIYEKQTSTKQKWQKYLSFIQLKNNYRGKQLRDLSYYICKTQSQCTKIAIE